MSQNSVANDDRWNLRRRLRCFARQLQTCIVEFQCFKDIIVTWYKLTRAKSSLQKTTLCADSSFGPQLLRFMAFRPRSNISFRFGGISLDSETTMS